MTFNEWYDDPITAPMSVHSNIDLLLRDYCQKAWEAALRSGQPTVTTTDAVQRGNQQQTA